MNELTPDSVRAVPLQKELPALLGLVICCHLCLDHHVGPGVSKRAAISKLAFAVELEVFAHFCSKLVDMGCGWSEVAVQVQA